MAFRLVRSPTTVVYQGTPAVPAAPARVTWGPPLPISGVAYVDSDVMLVSGTDLGGGLYLNPVVRFLTSVPAAPYLPATGVSVVVQGAKGWDGGGQTYGSIMANGMFSFRLVAPVAAMAGLSAVPAYGFSSIDYAWYLHEGTLEILEHGKVAYTFGTGIPEFVTSQWIFSIRRSGSKILYLFNDNLAYVSEVLSVGALIGVAMPYSVTDSIDEPVFGDWSEIGAQLPPIKCRMGDIGPQVSTVIPALSGAMVSTATAKMAAKLPALTAGIGTDYGRLKSRIPGLAAAMRSEPTFELNSMLVAMPGVISGMVGLSGAGGAISAEAPPLRARLSSGSYAGINSALQLSVSSIMREQALPIEHDAILLGDHYRLEAPMLMLSFDSIGVSDQSSVTIVLELRTSDSIAISGAASFGSIIELIANEQLIVNSGINTVARKEALQYSVNVATGALATYQGFDFDGFLAVGLESFGWRPDGLYRMRKGDDAGESIRGTVDFGASDLRDSHSKRCAQAWVGVRTDGQVFLRVIADNGEERVYRASGDGNIRRYTMAKGVAGRNWKFGLEVVDASFAEIDSLELAVGVMQRKLNGRK